MQVPTNSNAHHKFVVQVRTDVGTKIYTTDGADSITVHIDAIDRFGACGVTVTPVRAPQ